MTATRATQAPATEEADEWAADGGVVAFVVRGLVLVAIGWFIGGLIGAGIALAAVLCTWHRTVGLVAASAAALLVAAGFATVFEVTPTTDSLRSNFASVRPIASQLGLAAGIIATVAVVTAAWRERSTETPPRPTEAVADHEPFPFWAPWRITRSEEHRATLAAAIPWATLVFVSLVVLAVLAPNPLPPAMHQLVGNLRDGAGYVLGTAGHYRATGGPVPVPALTGAFGPGGASLALVVAGVGSVLLAMRLANRMAGRTAGVIAGVGVLVLAVITRQQLPAALATLALLISATLAADEAGPSLRAALSGVAFGVAVMCEPWTIMAAPLLVAWLGFGHDEDHPGSPGAAAVALLAAVLTAAPWQRYLASHFRTWAPSTDMALTLGSITPFLAVLFVGAVIILTNRRQPDAAPASA